MICNRTQTIKLTEEELNTLAKADVILYNLASELRNDSTIEINNSEWDYEYIENAGCLLDDLCKQGTKSMEVK